MKKVNQKTFAGKNKEVEGPSTSSYNEVKVSRTTHTDETLVLSVYDRRVEWSSLQVFDYNMREYQFTTKYY